MELENKIRALIRKFDSSFRSQKRTPAGTCSALESLNFAGMVTTMKQASNAAVHLLLDHVC